MENILKNKSFSEFLYKTTSQPIKKKELLDHSVELRISSSHSPDRLPASPNNLAKSLARAIASRDLILYGEADSLLSRARSRDKAKCDNNNAAQVKSYPKSDGFAKPSIKARHSSTSCFSIWKNSSPSLVKRFTRSIIGMLKNKVKQHIKVR